MKLTGRFRNLRKKLTKKQANKYKEYCSKICGGKCCHVFDEVGDKICQCPQLKADNTCAIYRERYTHKEPYGFSKVLVHKGTLNVINVTCGSVEKDILNKGILPPEVEAQCIYKNPDLIKKLRRKNENKKQLEKGV